MLMEEMGAEVLSAASATTFPNKKKLTRMGPMVVPKELILPAKLSRCDPATGSHRLNFAGSINSFGTTIGPILVSFFLFGKVVADAADKTSAPISSINILYIILGIAFGCAAL